MPENKQASMHESRPIPDPTVLTTEALHREVNALQVLLRIEMHALKEFFTEKLQTMEEYRIEQKNDTKAAVDAALQAAKEAVKEQTLSSDRAISKSEAGTSKQIDQQGLLINTATSGLNDKIDDIKQRITTIEGRSKGSSESWGYVIAGFGLLIALGALVVALIPRLH